MRPLLLILLCLLAILFSCKKVGTKPGTSECIRKMIKKLDEERICDSANVVKYKFQEKEVYVFNIRDCNPDGGSEVYDASCNNLGLLGGFAGNFKINGENFNNATLVETVWQKK